MVEKNKCKIMRKTPTVALLQYSQLFFLNNIFSITDIYIHDSIRLFAAYFLFSLVALF
jgi:hypothetical protein